MNLPKYSIPQHLIIMNHNAKCVETQTNEINELVEALEKDISTYETNVDNAKKEVDSKRSEYELAVLALYDDDQIAALLTELQELQEKLNKYILE